MAAFTDDDKMTFGHHKGKRLGDVPASWLLWAWDQFLHQDECPNPITDRERLAGYVANSMDELLKSCDDYILKYQPRYAN